MDETLINELETPVSEKSKKRSRDERENDDITKFDDIPLNSLEMSNLVLLSMCRGVEKVGSALRYPTPGLAESVSDDKLLGRTFNKWWGSWMPAKISALSPGYAFMALFGLKVFNTYDPDERERLLIVDQLKKEGIEPPSNEEIEAFKNGTIEAPIYIRRVAELSSRSAIRKASKRVVEREREGGDQRRSDEGQKEERSAPRSVSGRFTHDIARQMPDVSGDREYSEESGGPQTVVFDGPIDREEEKDRIAGPQDIGGHPLDGQIQESESSTEKRGTGEPPRKRRRRNESPRGDVAIPVS